jgi:ribosomal protein S18 acetylase RimI-like enzyme
MDLRFRETRVTDVEQLFDVRAATRENPLSREALAELGITPESTAAALLSGRIRGWVCVHQSKIVGFCSGHLESCEVLVLAVLPEYERRGIGKQLLARTVDWLRSEGTSRIWLSASPDPLRRAYGFYRAQGWQPTGERTPFGDEILAFREEPQDEGG